MALIVRGALGLTLRPFIVFEYCENGAKAVAEEATNKRVDRAFFAEHSVEDLSRLSDYEIGKSGRNY